MGNPAMVKRKKTRTAAQEVRAAARPRRLSAEGRAAEVQRRGREGRGRGLKEKAAREKAKKEKKKQPKEAGPAGREEVERAPPHSQFGSASRSARGEVAGPPLLDRQRRHRGVVRAQASGGMNNSAPSFAHIASSAARSALFAETPPPTASRSSPVFRNACLHLSTSTSTTAA